MTTDYRAMCAELVEALHEHTCLYEGHESELVTRARALLAQPVAQRPKPVVDYSRVPEIATEAQIRSAAQYLVKKRNCDGDLIDAIEYAIARWGRPTPQPVAEGPTDDELLRLAREWNSGFESIELHFAADYARAVLDKWGRQ